MAKLQQNHALASLTLIMNAAEGQLHLILANNTHPLCSQVWDAPVRGTEILAPALRQMLSGLALQAQHIGKIACVHGPGSFTGIRLVLATAAALRRVTGASMTALNYLQVLALGASRFYPTIQTGQQIWVLTHARRGLVHSQTFVWQGQSTPPQATTQAELISPAQVAANIQHSAVQHSLPPLVLGSGVDRNIDELQSLCPQVIFAPKNLHIPYGEDLLFLTNSLPEQAWTKKDIDPLYIRPCDAVDNLPQMALRQGLSPEYAAAELDRLLNVTPKSHI